MKYLLIVFSQEEYHTINKVVDSFEELIEEYANVIHYEDDYYDNIVVYGSNLEEVDMYTSENKSLWKPKVEEIKEQERLAKEEEDRKKEEAKRKAKIVADKCEEENERKLLKELKEKYEGD